jgi:antirestriction protein
MRVYIASLSDYNAGTMVGDWIDVTDKDTMLGEIAGILRQSKNPNVEVDCPDCDGDNAECATCKGRGKVPSAEEWSIHDYDSEHGFTMGENPDLDELCRMNDAIEEHGAAFVAWHNNSPDHNTDPDNFQEAYRGEWKSLEDYAENLVEDLGLIGKDTPELLSRYFDYESFGRDLELGGDVWTADNPEGGIFVFDNH